MSCFHPLQAYQTPDGSIVFVERGEIVRSLLLPCGRCVGCRVDRAREWSIRVMHESRLYAENSFVTLTYDDDNIPYRGSLCYSDLQRFVRSLRKLRRCGCKVRSKEMLCSVCGGRRLRFFACGEYGGDKGRPHFHIILFNEGFPDKKFWKTRNGFKVYRSLELSKLWKFGFHEIGSVTAQSAGYIARYSLKKVLGDRADDHYRRYDEDTGEVYYLEPELLRMSLKPGLGAQWLDKFGSDVYPHDRVIVDGKASKVPRFYDKKFAEKDAGVVDQLKAQRELQAQSKKADNTPERLMVKEAVENARLKFFKRDLR